MDKVRRKVGLPPSREPEVAKKSKRRGSSESSNQSKDSSLGIPSDISSDLLDSDDEIGVVEFAISSDEENVVGEANEESAFVDVLNFEGHAETEGDAHEIYAQYRGYPQIKQFRLSSEEMALLVAKISEYRDLICNRKTVLSRLYYEMRLGNILMKYRMLTGHYWEKPRHKNVLLRSYFGVRNVLLCMKDLRGLEEEYGYDLWAWKFLNCRTILIDIGYGDFQSLLLSSVLREYMNCFHAISSRNWDHLADILSDLDLSYVSKELSEQSKDNTYYMVLNNHESLIGYFPSLFLSITQCFLERYESPEETLGHIDFTCEVFRRLFAHRQHQWTNPFGFILLNNMVYKLCHNFCEQALALTEPPLLNLDANWQTTFSIYKLIAEYEVFRVNCSASQSQGWLSRIRQLIEILEQKERAVILLPPLIELSIELNDREGLFETFRDLCEQSPVIFEHVTRILKAHGQEREAYRLYEQLYNEHKSLAVFDTTIDFLYRFAAEPTAHGPLEDVVTSNLSAAFTTLDHGRNRNSLKAWTALHMSLRFVESQPGIIQRFWSPRKSWWPRFHFTFDERTECKKLKKKCFKRLKTAE